MTKQELIGLKAKVIESKSKTQIGIEGRIVDETKNTLSIETETKVKKVLKKEVTLEVSKKGVKTIIKGEELVGKPLERIKKKGSKKRW